MVFQEQLTVSTQGHGDMHDLTEQVADIVTRPSVRIMRRPSFRAVSGPRPCGNRRWGPRQAARRSRGKIARGNERQDV